MADHAAAMAAIATPESNGDDVDCLGKLSMTTMDGERDSTAYLLKQQPDDVSPELRDNQQQPELEAQSELENQQVEEEEEGEAAQGDTDSQSSSTTNGFVVVAQGAAASSASAVAAAASKDVDIDDLEELPAEFVAESSSSPDADTIAVDTVKVDTVTVAADLATESSSSTSIEELTIESTTTSTTTTTTEQAPSAAAALHIDDDEEHAAPSRRMTYIGEGLLDAGGMDAIDRLSDVSPYSTPNADLESLLTATTAAPSLASTESSSSSAPGESSQPAAAAAAINRLQAFLSLGGSAHKPAQRGTPSAPAAPMAAPVRAFPPPLAPQTPSAAPVAATAAPSTVATVAIENRRSKLLDFLANDVGERYLDGVYQEETRVAPDDTDASSSSSSDDDDGDSTSKRTRTPTKKNNAELAHERLQRTERANSKLLAFLAKERGERLHRVERSGGTTTPPLRRSLTSEPAAASTPASSSEQPTTAQAPKTPSKLLEFVAKVVPEKPKLVIFNPSDAVSETEELEHLVAEAAQRKKQKREERERARQKVLAFLAEEEHGAGAAGAAVTTSTVKSVDETKVQREKVVDRYGREGLLDFLDRTEAAQQQRIQWATARGSSHDSASPVSSASSSPKSLLPPPPPAATTLPMSPGATAPRPMATARSTPPPPPPAAAAPTPTGSLTRTPSSAGNRLASFLSKITAKHSPLSSSSSSSPSSSPEKAKASRVPLHRHASPQRAATAAVKGNDAISSSVVGAPAPATPETYNSRAPPPAAATAANKMPPVLAALEQITQTCATHELSDVSIARITTLLTSISQIVKDDVQRGGQPPVRRWSNASSALLAAAGSPSANGAASPSWVKSGKEIEEFDRKHAAPAPSAATTTTRTESMASPAVLERDSELKVTVAPNVLESFGVFESAQNLLEIVAAFHQLLSDCGLTDLKLAQPWGVYDHVKAAVAPKLSFRQKQLFKLLDAKLGGEPYATKPAARKRVCVIGAGPVGLRAAVEMALLGAQVVVLEKRKHFSRENILHLWPWVVQDVTALGAKVFFPQFCHSTAYFHVGTRQLQCILLKVALLLGVTFFPATAFDSIAHPDSVDSGRQPFYTVVTKPQIPWMEFTAVLGASGTQDRLSEQARIKRFVFSRKEAIGLVCYFPNHNAPDEKAVAEFSWTIQFKQQMFAKMRDIGVDLENIVYYRGEMHYLVMTPKRQNLLDQGVMKHDYPNVSDLVMDDNIDKQVLHAYLKRVVDFVKIPQKADFARVRIFDFSARTRADKAASILTSKGKKLYVGLIGDSLMEPFWPEGLGTCRGFLSALDGCWMVARVGFSSDEQLLADRELAYRIIQHVSGFRRDDLQKNVRKYTVDPTTRYNVKFPQLC